MAYYFELPLITDLTTDQQMALNQIESIAISGGAGTGKTVISLWRHHQNIEVLKKSSILITFTKTLSHYLTKNLDLINEKVYNLKNFPSNDNLKVNEIIIDEAQDLTYLKLQEIQNHTDNISYGADFNQQLYIGKVRETEIKALFSKNIEYNLQENFRNTYHILNFTKSIIPNFYISQSTLDELKDKRIGLKPIMFINNNNFEKEIKKIIEIINEFKSKTHNIAILLPFGNSGQESVEYYYKSLTEKNIECSRYYNDMKTDNIIIDNIHITTFKSSKGLEFDTIIIPFLNKFNNFISRSKSTKVNKEDYYVAFTRARRNLYLITNQELNFIDKNTVEIEYLEENKNEIPF